MIMELLYDTGVWLTLSFAIFLFILWKMGKTAIMDGIDNRIEGIKRDLQTAENLRIEAQELLAQYQRKHRDAIKEAEGIIANAESHADKIRTKAQNDLDTLVARREQQLQERLTNMKDTAEQDIRKYAADIVIKATGVLITEQTKKKDHSALINQSIETMSKEIH